MITTTPKDPQASMIIEMNQAKEARRRARISAPKAGAVRKIEDKRRKQPKHRKPLREE